MAATNVVPMGLREAEKLPFESGAVVLPPKLNTVKVVVSIPGGDTTAPLTVAALWVLNEKV